MVISRQRQKLSVISGMNRDRGEKDAAGLGGGGGGGGGDGGAAVASAANFVSTLLRRYDFTDTFHL